MACLVEENTAPTCQPVVGLLLLAIIGCQTPAMLARVESEVAAVTPVHATLGAVRPVGHEFAATNHETLIDLPALWQLAVANNPSLREAAADVEAARGQERQAKTYPNPRFLFSEDTIGSRVAPAGNVSLQIAQEIVTCGKRRLDIAIASRETDAASLGLASRKFDVLTRLRRAYYGYLGALAAVQLHETAVDSLEQGVTKTRKLVETVQNRPRTDLLRLESLLEETKINLARSRFNVAAAWKAVAAEVGVPDLPPPLATGDFNPLSPAWEADAIWQRVKAANSGLQQAVVEAERARLAVDRARADAIPNITVGGGYINAPIETTAGATISVEAPLHVWDLKHGHIRDAQAKWVKAQAAVRTLEATLSSTTADAFARYLGARQQVQKLSQEVLPRVQESVTLLRDRYTAGGMDVTFSDVLMTEQNLIETRLKLAEARQAMWQAVADLQGLMQLDIDDI
jgi:outer membrane protein, heavy metal efflux system